MYHECNSKNAHHAYSAILDNKIPAELTKYVPPAALNAGLPKTSLTDLFTAIGAGTPSALAQVPGINPTIEAAVATALANAYAAAYAYVYYAALAVGLVGLIGTLPPTLKLASSAEISD